MTPLHWQTTRHRIDLGRPRVMGIVNVTPDSFSDGGRGAQASLAHCETLLRDGADILDIGGESTRPGAAPVAADEELARVLPVLRHALTLGVPVSVDTSEPAVMRAALDLGADIVNDVRSLRRAGALALLAAHPSAGVCITHMQGEPPVMQLAPRYDDVVAEVADDLRRRSAALQDSGIAADRIVVDPGYGFGKTTQHNLTLLSRQRELLAIGRPLLAGLSRKGMLFKMTGRSPEADRTAASVAAALFAVQQGACVVRVHDVAATVDALRVWRSATAGAVEGR